MDKPNDNHPGSGLAVASRRLTRRDVLRGLAGMAGLGAAPALLASCLGGAPPSAAGVASPVPNSGPAEQPPTGRPASLTLASYLAVSDVVDSFTNETGIAVKVNTVFANDFGDGLDAYLAATPEDVITAGTGYSLRAEAAKGSLVPIDDLWAAVGSSFPEAVRIAVSAEDGHQYCLPTSQYPWAVFYRRAVFDERGYTVPATWDEYKALAGQMQRDGLVGIAFGNKELFPAMGMFDIINMRLNGYQFHLDLLAGKERWGDPRVKEVFLRWRELLPFMQPGANGRTWEQSARELATKQAGMYYFGMFLTSSVEDVDPSAVDDLGMFPFPSMGTPFDVEQAIDAPLEGFFITSRSPNLTADLENAKAFLEFLAQGTTQTALATSWGTIAPSRAADTSGYSPLQRTARDLMSSTTRAAQFLDRDTDRAFALKVGAFLEDFLNRPDQDLGTFLGKIQAAWSAA